MQQPHLDELFENAFEHAAIGMALVSLEGQWLKVNRSLCQSLGYAEADLLQLTFQDITHRDDLEIDLAYVRMLLAGEIQSYQLEKRYWHRDGRIVWVLLSVSLARSDDGGAQFFVSQIQDVTSRKEAAEALVRALQEKETLLEEMRASTEIIRKLREGLTTVCAWTKRIQYEGRWITVDEFLSRHIGLNLTHGISEEAAAQFLEESAQERERFERREGREDDGQSQRTFDRS